ncbi:HlyD family efflux transporter periplasmic adaptor subunit [Alcaligenes sp. SDU_A2]|uniref:HlyD family efflux transporter periplasmic adaptor subunit n=1 Tax=Alcaligenes sp. SDU_A2 TaxID=3136634 RepID=UPI00311DC2FF
MLLEPALHAPPPTQTERAQTLPPLRQDLQLHAAARNTDGSPAWMIQDPVTNRFFRIGWLEFELLRRWQHDPQALLEQLEQETPLDADAETLDDLVKFLEHNSLLRADSPEASARLGTIAARQRKRDLRWLLHNYLFVRVPLVRPNRLLQRMLHYLGFIYTRWFAALVLGLSLWGIVLASRQWDVFLVSFQDSFTPAGILAYMTALAFAKVMHELGHALTATRYGVRVAHMGVSFVVLFPMLYTDTSESWKLTDRRQRLAIVAAGVTTELAIAGLATLGWSLSSDGAVRSAFFFLATTSWILTVAINASPFMRFDGYFLLSDLLDFPNLHQRSFAFGRQRLRNALLGWQEPAPEPLSPSMQRFLTVFAYIVWFVRFTVFLGIAVSVYLYFFKALGIFLFLVEIAWFIVMPAWSEIKVWIARRQEIPRQRRIGGLLILTALVLFLCLPWKRAIDAPGWIRAESSQILYAPFPAQLSHIQPAGLVRRGQVLATFVSPDMQAQRQQAIASNATLWAELQRSGMIEEEQVRRAALSSRLRQGQAQSLGTDEELQRLELKAPFDGVISDLDPQLKPGVWVKPDQALGIVYQPTAWIAEAYTRQENLSRLQVGDTARVYTSSHSAPLAARVLSIDSTRTHTLPDPMLDAAHGGSIRVSTINQSQEVQQALYRVTLALDTPPAQARSQLVQVVIQGEPHSIAGHWLRYLGALAIRESGF